MTEEMIPLTRYFCTECGAAYHSDEPKATICNRCSLELPYKGAEMTEEQTPHTYWQNLPVSALRGTAIVADVAKFPEYWPRREGLIGTRIPVVLVYLDGVNMKGGVIFLDDRDDKGWIKLTEGYGSPAYPHQVVVILARSFRRL